MTRETENPPANELAAVELKQLLQQQCERLIAAVRRDVATRREQGQSVELDDYSARFPELRSLLEHAFSTDDHAESTAEFPATLPWNTGSVPPTSPAAAAVGRFRPLRKHARGGLGEVFVAADAELDRQVALKEIQEKYADDPLAQARFVLEAEITGRLEHPGTVPVYGLGRHADGRPYYAMRFIQGQSLEQALAPERKQKLKAAERTLSLRKVLARFITVCQTIEYAHSRGVIHRDLKPANIMLGEYGETLVVDWGLAKVLHEPASAEREAARNELSNAEPGVTQTGQTLGTPAYMSPEQAAGNLEAVGPASDVYGLGATLYCILTLQSPFQGPDVRATLQAVQEGSFPRPRELDASIPAGLEAICLRAMALAPPDRYASARALADDLEHWLADEPLVARPDTLRDRASRWMRRHRAWTQAGAASLGVLTVVLAVATWLINGSRQQEQAARQQADNSAGQLKVALQETQAALTNEQAARKEARQTVDTFVGVIEKEQALREPRLASTRQRILDDALTYYQQFVKENRGKPEVERELAFALSKVGSITRTQNPAQSLESYQEADSLLDKLLVAQPDDEQLQTARIEALTDVASLLHDFGRPAEAQQALAQVLQLAQADFERDRQNRAAGHRYAVVLLNNLLQGTLAAPATQVEQLRALSALVEELEQADPQSEATWKLKLRAAGVHGQRLAEMQQAVAAHSIFQQTLTGYQALPKELREKSDLQYEHAKLLIQIGRVHLQVRSLAEAYFHLQEGNKILLDLYKAYPRWHQVLREKSLCNYYLGMVANLRKDYAAAEQALYYCHNNSGFLLKNYPEWQDVAQVHFRAAQGLGVLKHNAGKHEEALALYNEAFAGYYRLVEKKWLDQSMLFEIILLHSNRAHTYLKLGKKVEYLADLQQAEEKAKQADIDPVRVEQYRSVVALLKLDLADEQVAQERHAEAIALALQAVDLLTAIPRDTLSSAHREERLTRAYRVLAKEYLKQGQQPEAVKFAELQAQQARETHQREPENLALTASLADRLDELADYLVEAGRALHAEGIHREALQAIGNCKPTRAHVDIEKHEKIELRARLRLAASLRQRGELEPALETLKPLNNKLWEAANLYELVRELNRCASALAVDAARSDTDRRKQAESVRRTAAWELCSAINRDKSLLAAADENVDLAAVMATPEIAAVRRVFEFVAQVKFENVRVEKASDPASTAPNYTRFVYDVVNASSVELAVADNYAVVDKFLTTVAYIEPLTESAKRLGIPGLGKTIDGRFVSYGGRFANEARERGPTWDVGERRTLPFFLKTDQFPPGNYKVTIALRQIGENSSDSPSATAASMTFTVPSAKSPTSIESP